MERYKAIGLMSGTSLDGVDVAACEFLLDNGKWIFRIHAAHTFPYSSEWVDKLSGLPLADALTFSRVNVEFGHLLGHLARSFIESTGFKPSIIASHGHTIFHQPSHGLTCQIGAGSAIAAETGISVVSDFRSLDVALGGQGAPLVPIGDRLLFGNYDACLNLGGFANISMELSDTRIAFDICPVNFVLNKLSANLGLAYDPEGENARKGQLDKSLLDHLNHLDFYALPYPKSLGREWVESILYPVLSYSQSKVEDLLRTFCEHIAIQVSRATESGPAGMVLVTGGGARNTFLMERIRNNSKMNYEVPDGLLVDFKEALVFAFLGILRLRGDANVLHSVTGSRRDHVAGSLFIR